MYMLVIEGEFHVCTCRKSWERGGGHGSASRSTSGKSIAACNSWGNGNRKISTLLALTLLYRSFYSAFTANRLRHFMTTRKTRTAAPSNEDHPFFFQAEDGIRDLTVTGVQTCALPI